MLYLQSKQLQCYRQTEKSTNDWVRGKSQASSVIPDQVTLIFSVEVIA
jgi:hypothetical protein